MNRKALLRAYKESRRPMGVYRVLNKINGRMLIGSSANVPAALNSLRAQLGMGLCFNRALQSDWKELGPAAFEFETLDTLTPPDRPDYDPTDDLRVLEAMWLDQLSPYDDRGYNARPQRLA